MRVKLLTLCCCVALAGPLFSQQGAPVTVPGLGTLTFPVTTASNAARQDFLRATLLLHVFHYEQARAAFRRRSNSTGVHDGLVGRSDGVELRRVERAVSRFCPRRAQEARADRGRTRRDGANATRTRISRHGRSAVWEREQAASRHRVRRGRRAARGRAIRTTTRQSSSTHWRCSGLNQGVRDVPTYQRALAIAMDVFRRHPDHPGASHYVIHASDDPEHAAIGLDAARALAKSSPAAEHAQHMTSHIFMALGMWDDLVTANERATHVIAVPGGAPMNMPE